MISFLTRSGSRTLLTQRFASNVTTRHLSTTRRNRRSRNAAPPPPTKRAVLAARPSVVHKRRSLTEQSRATKRKFTGNMGVLADYTRHLLTKTETVLRTGTLAERLASRKGPVMDERWWRWNIALAMMPAFLLMLLLRSVEDDMREHREGSGRRNAERLEAVTMGMEKEVSSLSVTASNNNNNDMNNENDNDNTSSSSVPELLARIEALERTRRQERRLEEYEKQRAQQSGTRNRADDRFLDEWIDRKKKDKNDDNHEPTSWQEKIKLTLTETGTVAVQRGTEAGAAVLKSCLAKGRELWEEYNKNDNGGGRDDTRNGGQKDFDGHGDASTETNYTSTDNDDQ